MARPKEINIDDLIAKFNLYIDNTDDPLIEEFAINYRVNRQYIYELAKDNEQLTDTITRAIEKQRVYLLKQGTKSKTLDGNIVRLRLIQPCHGFADKTTVQAEVTQNMELPPALKGLTPDQLKDLLKQAEKNS
ncbi:MAG: hypothetical protein Q8873_00600 [Bacillota bacterium]|nr:hypothetical protein [Bacillota bacterium]